MTDTIETTILEEGNVKITNLRAIIGTKTYAMSNITSISLEKNEPSNAPVAWGIVGVLAILISLIDIETYMSCMGVGLIVAFLGFYTAKTKKPSYIAKIGSASGETKLLSSEDRAYIKRIVNAVNEAIIRRG